MNKFSFFAVLIMCFIKLNADNRIILYLKTAPTNIINQALAEAKNEAIPEKNKQTQPSKTVVKTNAGDQGFFSSEMAKPEFRTDKGKTSTNWIRYLV